MGKEQWSRYRDLAMGGLLSLGVSMLAYMANSVNDLNQKLAIVLERQVWFEKNINDNRLSIKELEKEFKQRGGNQWRRQREQEN